MNRSAISAENRILILAILLVSLCQTNLVLAQDSLLLYDKNRNRVFDKESADFIQTISQSNHAGLFIVREYSKNNTLLIEATVSQYTPTFFFEGSVKVFNDGGLLTDEIIFKDNKRTNVYKSYRYLDRKKYLTSKKDSIAFYRVLSPHPTQHNLFVLKEFTKDNLPVREATVSKLEPFLVYEGTVREYSERGFLSKEVLYKENIPTGEERFYHSNGQLEKVVFYPKKGALPKKSVGFDEVDGEPEVYSVFDSLGNQLVKEGNGTISINSRGFIQRGKYLNGYKDSTWLFENLNAGTSNLEFYNKGKLVWGKLTKEGKETLYNSLRTQPVYSGDFNSFIKTNFRDPRPVSERSRNGTIVVTFVVEKDGSPDDFKVIKDLGFGTDLEAIRVIKAAGRWKPAIERGTPVRVAYTVPIRLTEDAFGEPD